MGRVVKGWGHRVPGQLLDAKAQATAILDAAHADAARLRAEAERLGADARLQYTEAQQRGLAEGRDAAAAEVLTMMLAARAEAAAALVAAKPAAVALAARMATKIVGRAVDASPALIADIATEALRASRAGVGRVKLRVHPMDRQALVTARPQLAAQLGAGAALEIVDDQAVGRYGCIVETGAGRLDARLETQVAVLEKALLGEPKGQGDDQGRS
ncbi:MAG: type secretion protein [Myxococcales bacterium]|jgi:flagellar biosynthesis/type III secretory pathway protein FliH|nr:type secretion protein [Myxococcales bacterium]